MIGRAREYGMVLLEERYADRVEADYGGKVCTNKIRMLLENDKRNDKTIALIVNKLIIAIVHIYYVKHIIHFAIKLSMMPVKILNSKNLRRCVTYNKIKITKIKTRCKNNNIML